MSPGDLSATKSLQPIAGLNLTQGLTDPMTGSSAGGVAPKPTSPVDIAKQNQATGGMLSQQVGAMDAQAQQFEQEKAMQAEQFKQQQATQQAEQQAQQAEQARKANEEALKKTHKTVEEANKQVVQTQLSSLKATGQQYAGLTKRLQGLRAKLNKGTGSMAKLKMASTPTREKTAGSVPVATGPSHSGSASLQPAPSAKPIFSSRPAGHVPSKSQQQIEGANHSTYEAQSAGLQRPGGATYQTPAGGVVSTTTSGRPPGIYYNGALMVKDPSGRFAPTSQAPAAPRVAQVAQPPAAPQPAAPQPAAPQPAAPQPAAPQPAAPQPTAPVMPDRPGTHQRALTPAPSAAPQQDHYQMAQQAAGGGPAVPPTPGARPATPGQSPELMTYLKEKTDPFRIPAVHAGIDDALLTSEDPSQVSWAENSLAQNYIKQHGVGTYNEAADYFSKAFGDPARGQALAERVFNLSNDQVRAQHAASKLEDYGANAPWYNPLAKLRGVGESLFDSVTGADQVGLDSALFQRPEHFGTKATLTPEQRQRNMGAQLARLTDKQELNDRWAHRHRLDQNDVSTFNRDFVSNMTGLNPSKDDGALAYMGKSFVNNMLGSLPSMVGNMQDTANAARGFDGSWGSWKGVGGNALGALVDGLQVHPSAVALTGVGAGGDALANSFGYGPIFGGQSLSQQLDNGTADSLPVAGGSQNPYRTQAPQSMGLGGGQMPPELAQYIQQNPQAVESLLPMIMQAFGGIQRTY